MAEQHIPENSPFQLSLYCCHWIVRKAHKSERELKVLKNFVRKMRPGMFRSTGKTASSPAMLLSNVDVVVEQW